MLDIASAFELDLLNQDSTLAGSIRPGSDQSPASRNLYSHSPVLSAEQVRALFRLQDSRPLSSLLVLENLSARSPINMEHLPAINFWLDHAKEQPFSLCVQSKYGYDKGIYNVRNVYNLFNIIAPFSSRCQELNVKIDSIDHVPFFTWKGGKVPALERLLLQVTNRINEDGFHKGDTIPPITVFDGAPALRAATLGFSSKRLSDPSYFPFPWHQLTHLKIVYRVLPKVSQEFLKQCINLEQASFVIGSLSDTANHLPRHPIITLGRLLSLKIILKEPFETQGLFRDYSFPNLRLFELSVKRTRDISSAIRRSTFDGYPHDLSVFFGVPIFTKPRALSAQHIHSRYSLYSRWGGAIPAKTEDAHSLHLRLKGE
ncbi:hypothetical protein C0989_009959 [Termitomyces sp. Mn162]|nr:hypothetical protein C0989_009959 [Termitomyces sp. Mn162]